MNRLIWCTCATPQFWIGDSASSHTSQHLFDPYSFSHFQHGIFFFALLTLIKRPFLSVALILEVLWEVLENTPYVIERYRTDTIALSYTGDSIINSLGDLFACYLGFLAASKLPWKFSLAVYLAIELIMLILIRDSLTLNVIMLLYPLESIKNWQTI